ncbi:MAG: hypothetical protein GTO02_13590 [Candidatus Dadabacteria bacterium]|nr:hypothetical protein [Candidatus Dadabacteria bacterium]
MAEKILEVTQHGRMMQVRIVKEDAKYEDLLNLIECLNLFMEAIIKDLVRDYEKYQQNKTEEEQNANNRTTKEQKN